MPTPTHSSPQDLKRLFSAERLSTYIDHCGGDFAAAGRGGVPLELGDHVRGLGALAPMIADGAA
jgi:hypothetical protein